jgi:redox-sensitive bicupin YhaK (pirin superfamily)
MIQVRPAAERGRTDIDWLNSRFSFSFDHYYDPKWTGFRSLRVINDDRVAPATGFPTHPHRDMEIITYMLEGELAHKDSMGNGSSIGAGEVQRMTAGTGVLHSEFNPSKHDPARLLQIWIRPRTRGLKPSYEQKRFALSDKEGKLLLIASGDGRDGSLQIQQEADLYAAVLADGQSVTHTLPAGTGVWLQVARGSVLLNGGALNEGDGAFTEDESKLEVKGTGDRAEFLLFALH